MNLRERVEHRARRLVELDGAADFERASEDLLGAFEVAELHEDLAERRECDGEAVTRSERLVQRDTALGERERLIVPMPHQCHVRLVVHDPREHVVGGNRHGEAFALAECGDRFFAAAGLREQDGGQRVHEREVATIAGGMQCGGGFCQMLANDAGIADLLVAERELVVRKADGARIVRELGVLERARVQRDRARLFASRERDAAVQPPGTWRDVRRKSVRAACPADGRAPRRPASDRPEEATPRPARRGRSVRPRG